MAKSFNHIPFFTQGEVRTAKEDDADFDEDDDDEAVVEEDKGPQHEDDEDEATVEEEDDEFEHFQVGEKEIGKSGGTAMLSNWPTLANIYNSPFQYRLKDDEEFENVDPAETKDNKRSSRGGGGAEDKQQGVPKTIKIANVPARFDSNDFAFGRESRDPTSKLFTIEI